MSLILSTAFTHLRIFSRRVRLTTVGSGPANSGGTRPSLRSRYVTASDGVVNPIFSPEARITGDSRLASNASSASVASAESSAGNQFRTVSVSTDSGAKTRSLSRYSTIFAFSRRRLRFRTDQSSITSPMMAPDTIPPNIVDVYPNMPPKIAPMAAPLNAPLECFFTRRVCHPPSGTTSLSPIVLSTILSILVRFLLATAT